MPLVWHSMFWLPFALVVCPTTLRQAAVDSAATERVAKRQTLKADVDAPTEGRLKRTNARWLAKRLAESIDRRPAEERP